MTARPLQHDAVAPPRPGECVLCYTLRQVEQHGCDSTLRWASTWRDAAVPTATSLPARLARHGGYCDCEIFLNGWTLRDDLLVYDTDATDDELHDLVGAWPHPVPACGEVEATSSEPCALWVPVRAGW